MNYKSEKTCDAFPKICASFGIVGQLGPDTVFIGPLTFYI